VAELGRSLHNRLQAVAEQLSPAVAEVRRRVDELRPAGHCMSGSGSSYFALCRDQDEVRHIAHALSTGWGEEVRPQVHRVTGCLEGATD
jgi:4-diphosphocytidyl-2C-methyl-D-erythritol kinase